MFARALARQNSQLLFIPAEFTTYFPFRFNENGIGESLLDEIRILNGLRTTLLLSNVMAGVRNSIAHTDVKITCAYVHRYEVDDDPMHEGTKALDYIKADGHVIFEIEKQPFGLTL